MTHLLALVLFIVLILLYSINVNMSLTVLKVPFHVEMYFKFFFFLIYRSFMVQAALSEHLSNSFRFDIKDCSQQW